MDVLTRDSNIYQVLQILKKRPTMFLTPVSIESINCFLNGYRLAKLDNSSYVDLLTSASPSLFEWIIIQELQELSTANSWVEALNLKSSSETEAFNKFFEHLEKYIDRAAIEVSSYLPSNRELEQVEYEIDGQKIKPFKIKAITYDVDREGVFLRFLNDEDVEVMKDVYQPSRDAAIEYVRNTFNIVISP